MPTPKYLGAGQPPAESETGLLGRIGAFFGTRASPDYAAVPVAPVAPAPAASVAASAPSVSTDPTQTTDASANACACHVERGCAIDPSLAGRIAIIVPHGFPFQGS